MSEWREVNLGEVVTFVDGDRGKNYPKKQDFMESGYCLFLDTSNVREDGFDFSSRTYISKEKDELLNKGRLARNDVVLTTRGTLGNVGFYSDAVPYGCIRINSGMLILRAREDLLPEYLYFVVRSRDFRMQVMGAKSGSAQPQIPIKTLKNVLVKLPSVNLQKRIVEMLSAYDELIENNRNQIKLLEEAAQRLYKEWFIDFKFPGYETTPIDPETSLPEGWKRTTIGNEFSITTGKRDANYGARDGLYPFFTCAREPIAATNYSFDTEAIILAGNGDLYSRLFRGKFEAYQRTYVIEPREKSYLFIGGKRVENEIIQLKAKAAGSTIKYLTKGMIESIEILLPSSAVLAKFNNMYEAIQSKMESLENSISLTAEVRDRLLPKLMSGEIEVS